jgi:hypothetical protein
MTPIEELRSVLCDHAGMCSITGSDEDRAIVEQALKALEAQTAVQEPVAIVVAAEYEDGSTAGHRLEWRGRNEANDFPEGTEFYTTPPAQTAVPLTEGQRSKMYRAAVLRGDSIMVRSDYELGISDAEAAHGITKGQP